ncbi:FAD/NAD(P)-binding protein [Rubellimicrobium arenae]|uniref:FAD/NAD(P)-binding protein n=1 Tax=Rubellimicrobium arenae TaxID=2817372 RepID=UPI001B30C29A|nr:FAD/NAD(P)-binding protein [Rubellimicrobium arenae]
MTPRIAIIGSGPTGIYTFRHLLDGSRPLDVTIFEAHSEAGWGMPYAPGVNGRSMLSNIAGLEIPAVTESLVAWLHRQPDAELARLSVPRERITDREFFPRVVLGEYFRAQLALLADRSRARGDRVEIRPSHRVTDIELREADILVTVTRPDGGTSNLAFDHVVMATGHAFPAGSERHPGWFASPYPTSSLRAIRNVHVGIRGTSLSAIDALVEVAGGHGAFLRDASGLLHYHPGPGTDGFRATLMSRKGLLPEADFLYPIPFGPNAVCTPEAVDALAASGRADLLDAVFDLFREELVRADPDYAARIGLATLDADSFADAYFREREAHDPFAWAARNLAEAQADHARGHVVPWRYAILRTHEVVARVLPHLSARDLERFHASWKAAFVDDYASVPHESIERLLALHRAGRLDVLRLGAGYRLDPAETGALVTCEGRQIHFPAFIDATGQRAMAAPDLPFPTLVAQDAVRQARSARGSWTEDSDPVETGGVELDEAFRPVNDLPLHRELHCLALPFLLHRHPFSQGLTSSNEMGAIVAQAILDRMSHRLLAPAEMMAVPDGRAA